MIELVTACPSVYANVPLIYLRELLFEIVDVIRRYYFCQTLVFFAQLLYFLIILLLFLNQF